MKVTFDNLGTAAITVTITPDFPSSNPFRAVQRIQDHVAAKIGMDLVFASIKLVESLSDQQGFAVEFVVVEPVTVDEEGNDEP